MPRRMTSTSLFFCCAILLFVTACGGSDAGPVPTPAGGTEEVPFRTTNSMPASLPAGYRVETVLAGLDQPTGIAATPDGRLLITEQVTGRVRVVEDGQLLDEPWLELDVYVAEEFLFYQEFGLVSIAVDPRFQENRYVYVYYTEGPPGGLRRTVFARLRDEDGRGTDLTELATVTLSPSKSHIAGGIAFDGPDAILLGVGDHEQADLAQELDAGAGKVLRIDREGAPLPDNPFVDDPGVDPRVYAYGVRNPFGLAVDPASGRAYMTDNRTGAGDALYVLEAGADYGWPDHTVAFREPLVIYQEPRGIAGVTVYRGDALPAFDGDVFFTTIHGAGLHWSDPGELEGFDLAMRDRLIAPGCSTGVTTGVDGVLYCLDYQEGRLLRISR